MPSVDFKLFYYIRIIKNCIRYPVILVDDILNIYMLYYLSTIYYIIIL